MLTEELNHNAYTLVVQSFGRENEYRRAVLTILSFFAFNGTAEAAILFTDNEDWFEPYFLDFPVQYVHLSPEKIRAMRGGIDFLHRMKIAEIEEAFELAQGNLLYADSDTFFFSSPKQLMQTLSPKHSFMHLWEYKFESLRQWALPAGKTFLAFLDLIDHKTFSVSNGAIQFDAEMSSWNAGVMMLHWEHRKLIPDVYALTEQFFPESQNHASEQYAFSLMLQNNTELKACDAVIYHYWYGVKKTIADEFLLKNLKQLIALQKNQKIEQIKQWAQLLPNYFEHHILTYKDDAIQAFNVNDYRRGYTSTLKALAKGAFRDTQFLKDILYHTKRKITKTS